MRVAAVDVNDDGRADLVVGAGPGQWPEARVFDAATLAVLDDFFASNPSFLGGVLAGASR